MNVQMDWNICYVQIRGCNQQVGWCLRWKLIIIIQIIGKYLWKWINAKYSLNSSIAIWVGHVSTAQCLLMISISQPAGVTAVDSGSNIYVADAANRLVWSVKWKHESSLFASIVIMSVVLPTWHVLEIIQFEGHRLVAFKIHMCQFRRATVHI